MRGRHEIGFRDVRGCGDHSASNLRVRNLADSFGDDPTLGSLFSGIGGIDLAFERAGFNVAWQVEIEPFCQKVLAKHFPGAKRYGDIRDCGRHNLSSVDVIAGGFPCQDISNAGLRAGIDGDRSGLWSEMHRIICELRPRLVLVENVAALLGRGIGRVLGDLAKIGYDAEWQIISAADVGAPHLRERVWILAYPMLRDGSPEPGKQQEERPAFADSGCAGTLGNATGARFQKRPSETLAQSAAIKESERPSKGVSDTDRDHVQGQLREAHVSQERKEPRNGQIGYIHPVCRGMWAVEPNVGRVATRVPARMDRLKGLGNAVVPEIPYQIAMRIREAM